MTECSFRLAHEFRRLNSSPLHAPTRSDCALPAISAPRGNTQRSSELFTPGHPGTTALSKAIRAHTHLMPAAELNSSISFGYGAACGEFRRLNFCFASRAWHLRKFRRLNFRRWRRPYAWTAGSRTVGLPNPRVRPRKACPSVWTNHRNPAHRAGFRTFRGLISETAM